MELTKDEIIKASIIEAAQKLFQHYGLSKTTMEDIAKSLNKSKGSLYYYFTTKEQIFEAVVQKEKNIILNDIKTAMAQANTAEEKFKVFALTKFNEIKKREILYKIIHDDILDNVCLFQMIRKRYDSIELEIIKEILTFGIKNKEFGINGNKQLDAVALVCAITLRGVQMDFIFDTNTDCSANDDLLNVSIDMLVKALKNCK
ncbi:MAG: helix-turn-helix domain containing protein [Flavipsychrobacter sp.]|nr:helix-turn-helix domain containing protein [Flavipsychrobacter sp.]